MARVEPLRHLLSILALPVTVTLVVPYALLAAHPGRARALTIVPGTAVIAAGLVLVCGTIARFATVGRGTLAPWDPPTHLVVVGVYRYVRNPMISGVVLILLGEAVVFASTALLVWAAAAAAINGVYIPLVEEPGLERRFGDEYRRYRDSVPRWIPRRTPWTPPARRD